MISKGVKICREKTPEDPMPELGKSAHYVKHRSLHHLPYFLSPSIQHSLTHSPHRPHFAIHNAHNSLHGCACPAGHQDLLDSSLFSYESRRWVRPIPIQNPDGRCSFLSRPGLRSRVRISNKRIQAYPQESGNFLLGQPS
jgi:hypothetical protein